MDGGLNAFMAFSANCVPLSVIICIETPNLQTIFLKTNLTALSCVIDLTDSASAYFVKYSTATKAYFLPPLATGNGPMMTKSHLTNGTGVMAGESFTDGTHCRFAYL